MTSQSNKDLSDLSSEDGEGASEKQYQQLEATGARPKLHHQSQTTSDRRSSRDGKRTSHSEQKQATTTAKSGRGLLARSRTEDGKKPGRHSPSEEEVERLREAVNARILSQQRSRIAPSPLVSSIPEDDVPRPHPLTHTDSLASNVTTSTDSTDSTRSTASSRTVRGSVPATPYSNRGVQTPSYPFPIISGKSKSWYPFTDLSPTVTNQPLSAKSAISEPFSPELNTPTMTNQEFLPTAGQDHAAINDPRFPTPNLYDMILQLNAEPGLDVWWSTVTTIMHEHFHVERATVVMPADVTDIENVPWGQKATFNMNGREEFVSRRTVLEQTLHSHLPNYTTEADLRPQKLHPERLRPSLVARHSYAGPAYVAKGDASETQTSVRPKGPQRVATHAPGLTGGGNLGRPGPRHADSVNSIRHTSITDPDFSSVAGGVDAGPNVEMLSTLRALDHEAHPLIETSGVYRVLERGRVVTVTRDYTAEISRDRAPKDDIDTPDTEKVSARPDFGNHRNIFAADDDAPKAYEEYEQVPSSPWAQSPAPSPAMQIDEERNPFFASESDTMEESFNPPSTTPKDYSRFDQVEAIGIDQASTVMHIPLIHPKLSQPMPALHAKRGSTDGSAKQCDTVDDDRKTPIAILSILSSTVPYPPNLTSCLRLLAPHLATSFALAQQFAYTNDQITSTKQRRQSIRSLIPPGMDLDSMTVDDLFKAGILDNASHSGSLTSPSEYSVHSKHSPISSPLGTPSIDASLQGTRTRKTSSATETRDYFGSRESTEQTTKPKHAGATASNTPGKIARKSSVKHRLEEVETIDEHEENTPKGEPSRPSISASESARPENTIDQRPKYASTLSDRRHSVLHSYGAQYQPSSFAAITPAAGLEAEHDIPQQTQTMPPPSERLLRTIIDSLPVQVFTAAPDTGRITWVNSKFLIYRGQDPQQVLGDPWQAIHPDDRNEYMDSWSRCLKTGQQLQQKVRLQRFDGSYRWFYVRAAPLKDKRQHTVHWIGTNMDFHEQQIAETNSAQQQKTAASEAKYRALANSSPQIVFAVNRVKGVIFCNSQWMLYSGQTEAQALGVGFMDHIHPADLIKCHLPTFEDDESDTPTNVPTSLPPEPRRTVSSSVNSSTGSSTETEKLSSDSDTVASPVAAMPQRKLSELASSGIQKVSRDADGRQSYSTEVRLKSKDGDYRWHLVRVVLAEPMQHSQSEETWYGTCTDINDHKTLEKNLKDNMDEKSRFLSNMSHEIRTPLNGITGMVNFLIDSNLTAEQMEHVNIIRASTEGLRGLINDILDLSKAEAGMIQLSMGWMFPRDLIEEVNDLTSTMAIDKGLELNYHVDDNVPAQIKGDRFRIRQILLNIVGNAIKFTQKGEVFVRCSLSAEDTPPKSKTEIAIRFEVIDTGRGFTDQEAEHLFKRFSQIDGSSTRQHGGTGLGLVISRQLAQLHGGDMSARGVLGKGATFSFFIMTSLPTQDDQPPQTSGEDVTTIPILPVADDEDEVPTPAVEDARITGAQIVASPVPSPDITRDSPGVSSAGSNPSITSTNRSASLQSTRSSISSSKSSQSLTTFNLVAPKLKQRALAAQSGQDNHPVPSPGPPMFSILVVAPLKYSREATVQHINKTVPENIPHTIHETGSVEDAKKLFTYGNSIIFSHIVTVLQDVDEIISLMNIMLQSVRHSSTCMVIITDLAQRRTIVEKAKGVDFKALEASQRLLFIFKPLKPSRFGAIFDPQREREMSTDRSQDSAQQVAMSQKQVFEHLTKRLGNQDKRVLLVEDNKVNQMVILKFLGKISMKVETALDGVQCTEKVFAHEHGYYSIILCDLHMPNKDGYQTCKEIRKWEKKSKFKHLPIIALSANVLGDVYQKCVDAGFNSYITKPVDFKELSTVLMTFMDPRDPSKPHEFMKTKGTHAKK